MLTETTAVKLRARGIITEKYIGKGAFGSVYTCRKHFGRKKYAAKVVEHGDDNKIKWQTENEIEILKDVCSHSNIVGLQGVFRDSHSIVVILEYIPGPTFLEGILNWPHLQESDVKKVLKQILDALRFCHSRRIIHRDISPDNILWCDVPTIKRPHAVATVKLIDFNLSRKMPEHLAHIRADALGNPSYMAPECLQEEPITSCATDMWSVGVLAFLLMGGYPPFFNDNYNHLLKNILEGNYEMPSELWHHVSCEAKDLITKLLHVDVKTRPTTEQILSNKWFQHGTCPTKCNKKDTGVWQAQIRLKGFLHYLNEMKKNSSHRKYSLVHKERKAFVPHDKMLALPNDNIAESFYENFTVNTVNDMKKTDNEFTDQNNNNNNNNNNDITLKPADDNFKQIDLKRRCCHW